MTRRYANFAERLDFVHSSRRSLLLVGLDPLVERLPAGLSRDASGVTRFLREIIEACSPYAIGFKTNFAFFERLGAPGWRALEQTRRAIPEGHLAVADAKRGDIGDSSEMYAQAIFDAMDFHAVTVSPWTGKEGLFPFLQRADRCSFVLCRTSNRDPSFQEITVDGRPLYEIVAETAAAWSQNVGLVVGATDVEALRRVRAGLPDTALLVPGVGVQGGDLRSAVRASVDSGGGKALISASRSILYASDGSDFAQAAAMEAERIADVISEAAGQHTVSGSSQPA